MRKHEPWSSGTVHDFKEFRRIRNFGATIITIDPTVFEADGYQEQIIKNCNDFICKNRPREHQNEKKHLLMEKHSSLNAFKLK